MREKRVKDYLLAEKFINDVMWWWGEDVVVIWGEDVVVIWGEDVVVMMGRRCGGGEM